MPQPRPRMPQPRALCFALLVGSVGTLGCEGFFAQEELDSSAPLCQSAAPEAPPGLRLLSRFEYKNSLRDLFGIDADTQAFPSENEVEGFGHHAASQRATSTYVEAAAKNAALIAATLLSEGSLNNCLEADSTACAADWINATGRRVYRRPLYEEERSSLVALYADLAPNGSAAALSAVIETMLSSPAFLYRHEAAVGANAAKEPSTLSLTPLQLASRLSYFVWASTPDDELLALAESGALTESAVLEEQARRLLRDPRSLPQLRQFYYQWLGLNQFATAAREGAPEGASLAWQSALLQFVEKLHLDDATQRELFQRKAEEFVGPLAALYRSEVPEEAEASASAGAGGMLQAPASHGNGSLAPPDKSGGLLTHPALMALLALSDQSSPIRRGVYVRQRLLCDEIPAPPADVDTNPPDPAPGLTTRERFAVHTEDEQCASCHSLIDPTGFLFENFDQLGRYREREYGEAIDTSGELVQAPGLELQGPLGDAFELAERLQSSDQFTECMARKYLSYALGRGLEEADDCSVTLIKENTIAKERKLNELLIEVVKSPSFRTRRGYRLEDLAP